MSSSKSMKVCKKIGLAVGVKGYGQSERLGRPKEEMRLSVRVNLFRLWTFG